jgi:hypothetical protein
MTSTSRDCMTGELYRTLERAADEMSRLDYAQQREAYMATHKSGRSFRYRPSDAHQFLVVLMGTRALDTAALADAVNSYITYRTTCNPDPDPETARVLRELRSALQACD